MGNYQTNQYMHCGHPRKQKETGQRIFGVIKAKNLLNKGQKLPKLLPKNFLNLMKDVNINIKEA